MKKTSIIIIQLAIIAVAFISGNWFANRRNTMTTNSQPKGITTYEKYQILKKLSVGVQISYFDKHLGAPTYVNQLDTGKKEYVYTDKDFFVGVVTDPHDKVLSYTIISRNHDFNPSFGIKGLFDVSLNKTVFSEWITDKFFEFPHGCYRFLGAHDPLYYFEKNYFGNPGKYLTYLVGVNNAANFDGIPATTDDPESPFGQMGWINCEVVEQTDRERLTPNTFVVLGMDVKTEDLEKSAGVYFGPSNIQLRTLNE